jgi:hypothetical protein
VTGSVLNSWNRHALSAYKKLYLDLWKNGVFYNIILLVAIFWAVCNAITSVVAGEEGSTFSSLMTSIAFPPLLHACYLTLMINWVPVAYILKPPHYPNRPSQPTENGEKPTSRLQAKSDAALDFKWAAAGKVGKEILHLGTRLEIQERPEL